MRLTPMRFKNFTWPHNPEIYTVEYRRRIAVHQAPFGGCVMQDLGDSYRVLKGEGVFVGESAYEQFKALADVFYQDGPGLLVHPVWPTERAYFASLEVVEEPTPDFVRYRFEFWEDWNGFESGLKAVAAESASSGGTQTGGTQTGAAAGSARSYTVRKGDTLWGIARQYGVELAALIKANPQIKNPNLIYPGEAVKVP